MPQLGTRCPLGEKCRYTYVLPHAYDDRDIYRPHITRGRYSDQDHSRIVPSAIRPRSGVIKLRPTLRPKLHARETTAISPRHTKLFGYIFFPPVDQHITRIPIQSTQTGDNFPSRRISSILIYFIQNQWTGPQPRYWWVLTRNLLRGGVVSGQETAPLIPADQRISRASFRSGNQFFFIILGNCICCACICLCLYGFSTITELTPWEKRSFNTLALLLKRALGSVSPSCLTRLLYWHAVHFFKGVLIA